MRCGVCIGVLGVVQLDGMKARVVAEDTGCVTEERAQGVHQTDPALPLTSYLALDKSAFGVFDSLHIKMKIIVPAWQGLW